MKKLSCFILIFPIVAFAQFPCDFVLKDDFETYYHQLDKVENNIILNKSADVVEKELIEASKQVISKLKTLDKRCQLKDPS